MKKFSISSSPHLKSQDTTPGIMLELCITLIPLYGISFFYFGWSAIWMGIAAVLGSVLPEYLTNKSGLKDRSSILTGLLLALTLPPGFPLWMAFLGGFVSVSLGKLIWGGLGQNMFNPALVGRAFLQSAFPTAITTWANPEGWSNWVTGHNLAIPFLQGKALTGITGATPLSAWKFEHTSTNLNELLTGDVSGSLGETAAVLILLIGVYLYIRKIITWRIPITILLTTAVLVGVLHFIFPDRIPEIPLALFSGGLLFGTIYMATDPVSSPLAPGGQFVFGIGVAVLIVLIRYFGGLPEGVMYAILIMNAFTPLINRWIKIKPYGHK